MAYGFNEDRSKVEVYSKDEVDAIRAPDSSLIGYDSNSFPYYTLGTRKTATAVYSSSNTYNVGAHVLYGGVEYVCTTKIETAEAWDSSHWSKVNGRYSVAEGNQVTACGYYSHAEGYETAAISESSHAEGYATIASGDYSHAEGYRTKASGQYSHAEGSQTTASGLWSHAEGSNTNATAFYSHAEGVGTIARGGRSHAQNDATIAASSAQTAMGTYNAEDTTSATTHPNQDVSYGTYALIIGNGTASYARSDALEVAWNGNMTIAGTLTQSSDRRLKEHEAYLADDASDFIRALKPALFIKDGERRMGFYAQDVRNADLWHSDIVSEMNGYLALDYQSLIAPLVAYCQRLEQRIEELEER